MTMQRPEKPSLIPVLVGAGASVVCVALFLVLEKYSPRMLNLPDGWIVLTAIPVVVGLFVGKYITYVKTPLGEIGRTELHVPADANVALPGRAGSVRYKTAQPEFIAHDAEMEAVHDAFKLRCRDLALVHVFAPAEVRRQKYEVFIFLSRHVPGEGNKNQAGNLDHIVQDAEFFFGASWGNNVFHANTDGGGPIGIKTYAWGSFWATCKVTFRSDPGETQIPDPVYIHRYIDFESADIL